MKKLFIVLLSLLLTGCFNINQDKYDRYLNELKQVNEATEINNYNISISFDKYTDDEVIYQVVIDKALITLSNIQVLVYHDQETKDIYPSVGLFDDLYNLVPETITKDNINIHGINLVGYIPYNGPLTDFKANIKVLIMYNQTKDYYVYQFDKNI